MLMAPAPRPGCSPCGVSDAPVPCLTLLLLLLLLHADKRISVALRLDFSAPFLMGLQIVTIAVMHARFHSTAWEVQEARPHHAGGECRLGLGCQSQRTPPCWLLTR